MQVPLQISFRDVERTPELDDRIRRQVEKLEKVGGGFLVSCRVAVEQAQDSQQTGNPYRVRIVVRLPPNKELVVTREDSRRELWVLLLDAFDAMRRQVQDLSEKLQTRYKLHPEQQLQAFVSKLFEDYGFIETLDGREVYFHRNSVLNDDFARLEVGTGVAFAEEMGTKGPQASTVQIVDKPGGAVSKETEEFAARPREESEAARG